jgi:hypothetical protein
MGYAVPGGPEITGVLVLAGFLLEQATQKGKQHKARIPIANCRLPIADLLNPSLLEGLNKSAIGNRQSAILIFILYCGSLILFLGKRFAGDSILTFNPPAEIDKLTPLRTEGTKRIVFPLDRLTAGWAFHES